MSMTQNLQKNGERRDHAAVLPVSGSLCCLLLVALAVTGCNIGPSDPSTAQSTSQTYFGPATNGTGMETFAIDHTANPACPMDPTTKQPDCSFVQYQYSQAQGFEQYVYNSGYFTSLPNGVLSIGLTYSNGTLGDGTLASYNAQAANSWAVELPGLAGLVGLSGQAVVPIAPNQACPNMSTAETFQFITLPIAQGTPASYTNSTAYGSVSIGTSGSTVDFNNISQYTVSGSTISPAQVSVQGTCGPTFYGQTISVPNTVTVTNTGNNQSSETPTATIVLAPSGFLVEDDGLNGSGVYQNLLGAGVGAIGLPVPTSALTTSTLTGTQYVGFIYSTGGLNSKTGQLAVPPSSLIASFGFPSQQQSSCTTLNSQISSMGGTLTNPIWGGNFPSGTYNSTTIPDDPNAGPGNCNFAVDLGVQSATTNGLYPNATVWVGSAFPRTPSNQGNPTQSNNPNSFSAVAIAGQIQGKYAIFLVGYDPTSLQSVATGMKQDWGIYLLQTN